MNFGFVLHFDELSEELQNKKIDEWIMHQSDSDSLEDEDGKPIEQEYALSNEEIRNEARRTIQAYFPIYF